MDLTAYGTAEELEVKAVTAIDGEFNGHVFGDENDMFGIGAFTAAHVYNKATGMDSVVNLDNFLATMPYGRIEAGPCKNFFDQPEQQALLAEFEKIAEAPVVVVQKFEAWLTAQANHTFHSNGVILSSKHEYVTDSPIDQAWAGIMFARHGKDRRPLHMRLGTYMEWQVSDQKALGFLCNIEVASVDAAVAKLVGRNQWLSTHNPMEDAEAIVQNYINLLIAMRLRRAGKL